MTRLKKDIKSCLKIFNFEGEINSDEKYIFFFYFLHTMSSECYL